MKKNFAVIPVILTLLVYVLFCPAEALKASLNGLMLWFYTLLPTLLPFLILTNIVNSLDLGSSLTFMIRPFASVLFCLSGNGCYILLMGLLCGFPMGAKLCGDFLRTGRISRQEAQFLLPICNMISPAFLISYLLTSMLHRTGNLLPFLICIYAPVFVWGLFSSHVLYNLKEPVKKSGSTEMHRSNTPGFSYAMFDECIMNSFEIITRLGGYLILFSLLSAIVSDFPIFSESFRCILLMLLEITNGAKVVTTSTLSEAMQIFLILTGANLGGFSFLAQTCGMLNGTKLSIGRYIMEKAIISAMTAFLCILLIIQHIEA